MTLTRHAIGDVGGRQILLADKFEQFLPVQRLLMRNQRSLKLVGLSEH